MSNGPLPSERTLLSALCKKQVGDKVRFLGCVTEYSTRFGQITLKHHCPKEDGDIEALVDVNLLLKSLKSEQTDLGQWIHVIGYITFLNRTSSSNKTTPRVGVQALVVWIAQDLDLGVYEKSMLAGANESAGNSASINPASK
ncbi:CST complex subunit Ten1 [Xylaria bambusicola]|uniref:CST complex subunit Ten1 n=1 Tax=Xylaria bambusicola TaxID=326684 RepID=UPI0020084AE0|nr:CST complex subunit Ten1 [Xylaria bambusicola]KAI0528176.1 CST complex subunit Ten1 [Xylaria bambusicola]